VRQVPQVYLSVVRMRFATPLYIQSMQRAVHDAGSQKTAFKLIEFC